MKTCSYYPLAFFSTFLLSTLFVSVLVFQPLQERKDKIIAIDYSELISEVLLKEDKIRRSSMKSYNNRKQDGKMDIPKTLLAKIHKTKQIDVSNLPRDFQRAWHLYLFTRQNSLEFTKANSLDSNLIPDRDHVYQNIFMGLNADRADAIGKLVKVSRKYGAKFPGE